MKVVTSVMPIIKLVPRFYPELLDVLVFTMDNGAIITFTWTIVKNKIVITLDNVTGLIQGEKYSFTITKNQYEVYKGQIIFVADNTDIQNYSTQSQNTKRWQ